MVQEKLVSSEKTKNDNNVYHDEPALRFPEFNDSWKRIKIHEITDSITKGTTPKNYSEEGINFIKVENIENNQIININSYIDVNTHKNELSRSILEKNDLLFSKDEDPIRRLVQEAPFSNPFKNSPGRIGAFIGWRIIVSYMEKHPEISLNQLMQETNSRAILDKSGYKPLK